ncbi:VOC family protein [Aureibaculum conchae]|uniref:glyoxalase/bleomycin resistance/extradiol dioxygenase family protein n=1 Tax=Aureibaculum sp. 2308TA14-22 TaxID=3108392 RepID=UPI003395F168
MKTKLFEVIPVLPSSDIDRDVTWYKQQVGFEPLYKDNMYAILKRENITIHLQWHADTVDDPLLGGSVIRIAVKNIESIFQEFVKRGTVSVDKLRENTDWNTNEFGFYDLNKNAVFIFEVVKKIS